MRHRKRGQRLSLVLLGCGLAWAGGAEGQERPAPAAAPLSAEQAEQWIEEIRQVADIAARGLASLSSDRLQREAILEQTDYQPAEIFDWVVQNTSWVPYRGVLRGAAGVMMDRRGNSLDRSLLLAALLEDAGFDTRLASASLTPEAAAGLWRARAAGDVDLDGKTASGENDSIAAIRREVREQADALAEMVDLESVGPRAVSPEAVQAAVDHWWVQARLSGGWQDLDPTLPSASSTRGAAPAPALFSLDRLPPELFHRLSVRLVIERWQQGELREETPLAYDIAPAQLPLYSQLKIRLSPFAEEWIGRTEVEALDEATIARSARFWRPSLEVAGEVVTGEWFSDRGQLEQPASFAAAARLRDGQVALGGLGSGELEADPDRHLTAAWIEYEILAPGRPTNTIRRELFDLLGPGRQGTAGPKSFSMDAARRLDRGWALQGQTAVLPLVATPHPVAVDRAVLETLSSQREFFIALVVRATGEGDGRVPRALDQASFQPVDLLAMAAVRELWSRHASRLFLDRVNLFSRHVVAAPGLGGVSTFFATDLVENRVGVLPAAASAAPRIRLEQGVLDTRVETLFAEHRQAVNTYREFAARAGGGPAWVALAGSGSAPPPVPASLPEDDRRRIRWALEQGHRVVVAPRSYSAGGRSFASWWRIDPRDGSTLGMGYRGWGSELPEETSVHAVPMAVREAARRQGISVGCRAAEATLILSAAEMAAIVAPDRNPLLRSVLRDLRNRPGRRTISAVCKLR